jgi:hypothetical protein
MVSESSFLTGSVTRTYLTHAAIREQHRQVCSENTDKLPPPATCDSLSTSCTRKEDDCGQGDEPPAKKPDTQEPDTKKPAKKE